LGFFPKEGGRVFSNPKTFVNLPSVFLDAKIILRCQNMFYNSGEVISDQFNHITLDSKSRKFWKKSAKTRRKSYKQVAQSVKIICTRYRNQVQCFQIISYDLLLCEQNCTNGWELDDHRFQSKLVIIPFYFQPLPPQGRSDEQHPAKYSFERFRTLLSLFCIFTRSSIDVSWVKIIGI